MRLSLGLQRRNRASETVGEVKQGSWGIFPGSSFFCKVFPGGLTRGEKQSGCNEVSRTYVRYLGVLGT